MEPDELFTCDDSAGSHPRKGSFDHAPVGPAEAGPYRVKAGAANPGTYRTLRYDPPGLRAGGAGGSSFHHHCASSVF